MYNQLPIGLNQDRTLNRAVCTFSIKQPRHCSEKEINDFYQLILKGKKLSPNGLLHRIRNCELLAFCHIMGILIGVSAIKKPLKGYVKRVISKTTITRDWKELSFEIGYSTTVEDYRRNGISKTLKSLLLEEMKSRKGIIFSVTANMSSQNFLKEYGFKARGISYDGINDIYIKYYEIEIKDLK